MKSPKIYSYESGLVSALLQVETPAQASRDLLLGGMFENMIVSVVKKCLLNRGRHDIQSFYRDSSSLEVDLILEKQRIPFAFEIKASRTFSPDFLCVFRKFKAITGDVGSLNVLYGGIESLTGTDYSVWDFAHTYRAIELL